MTADYLPQNTARRLAQVCVLALAALSCLLACAPAVAASAVKVAVAASEVVGRDTPRVFGFSGNIWYTPEAFGSGLGERLLAMPHPGLLR